MPVERERLRIRGRGPRAPGLAQPHGAGLERDAVLGEAREERRSYAALGGHPRERALRVDQRATGIVRRCERATGEQGGRERSDGGREGGA
jgi:hypothetical protein